MTETLTDQLKTSNPVLLEALAEAAHCTPDDAAEHLAGIDPNATTPVSLFLDEYTE